MWLYELFEITMTKEEKSLLLKDLCARLPYGIVINIGDKDLKLDKKHQCIGVLYPEDCSDEFNKRNNNASFYITISGCYYGEKIKPYLRPMSSMTDVEKKELWELLKKLGMISDVKRLDWLVANHFDIRNLIEKGLALEAPEGMYNIK